jgi:hypothetical protein
MMNGGLLARQGSIRATLQCNRSTAAILTYFCAAVVCPGCQVLAGLKGLHSMGIVHRDIKPGGGGSCGQSWGRVSLGRWVLRSCSRFSHFTPLFLNRPTASKPTNRSQTTFLSRPRGG